MNILTAIEQSGAFRVHNIAKPEATTFTDAELQVFVDLMCADLVKQVAERDALIKEYLDALKIAIEYLSSNPKASVDELFNKTLPSEALDRALAAERENVWLDAASRAYDVGAHGLHDDIICEVEQRRKTK